MQGGRGGAGRWLCEREKERRPVLKWGCGGGCTQSAHNKWLLGVAGRLHYGGIRGLPYGQRTNGEESLGWMARVGAASRGCWAAAPQHMRRARRAQGAQRRCSAPAAQARRRRLFYCRRFFWLHQLTQGAQSRQKVPAGHSCKGRGRRRERGAAVRGEATGRRVGAGQQGGASSAGRALGIMLQVGGACCAACPRSPTTAEHRRAISPQPAARPSPPSEWLTMISPFRQKDDMPLHW